MIERIRALVDTLNEASEAYFAKAAPIMSDYEYDALYDELARLEKSSGVVLANSPTRNVGYAAVNELVKAKHAVPMLSLDKTKSVAALETFLDGRKGVLSWKLDGLTIALTYEDGHLAQALTRGAGETGEDVTHNARAFINVPSQLAFKTNITVRGEAVILFSDFAKINDMLDDGEKYKNPRNLCSGAVRQLNSEITKTRRVRFYAFALLSSDVALDDSRDERMKWLERAGFEVCGRCVVTGADIADAVAEFKRQAPMNDFASDGLVLAYDSVSYGESLGRTSKFPKDSIALKWADETARTTLLAVEWNTSRTGLINPTAVFEPVELEGTTISRASLHNVSVLESLELHIGDEIEVYKANMIIPQIAGNVTRDRGAGDEARRVEIPSKCGVCGDAALVMRLIEGRALYCQNPACKARLVRSLAHFASRDAMNIEGLSESTILKFVEKGFLSDFSDIYALGVYADEIRDMEGFGEKSLVNLLDAVERSKDAEPAAFVNALGIQRVGRRNASLICEFYNGDIRAIMESGDIYNELCQVKGLGEVTAKAVEDYFARADNRKTLEKLLGQVRFKNRKPQPNDNLTDDSSMDGRLQGETFVITGDVNRFANRSHFQGFIESLGGKVTSSVTTKTTCLINNNAASESSKNKKARELGVPVLSEDEFFERYGINFVN
jgi:DNA ligase (NAD+)